MAKKKSSRFIIPATYFANSIIEEKLDVDTKSSIKEKEEIIAQESKPDYKQTPIKEQKLKPAQLEVVEKPIPEKLDITERRKSILSLSSLKRKKIEEEKHRLEKDKNAFEKDLPNTPFSEEIFMKTWRNYIDSLHQNGEKIFASILKADTPKIKENTIFVTYPNSMMKAELLKVKSKALKHLRKELNNYSIDFNITVNEENAKNFAYTPQEKYELLKEKNKAITLLKKTFNLEL